MNGIYRTTIEKIGNSSLLTNNTTLSLFIHDTTTATSPIITALIPKTNYLPIHMSTRFINFPFSFLSFLWSPHLRFSIKSLMSPLSFFSVCISLTILHCLTRSLTRPSNYSPCIIILIYIDRLEYFVRWAGLLELPCMHHIRWCRWLWGAGGKILFLKG